jgi:hypothetical protein
MPFYLSKVFKTDIKVQYMNGEFTNNGDTSQDHSKNQSKKTRSVSFRLDSSVLDELQRESDQREVSLNVLVNQTLKRYADWDRYESRIGMMPVPKVMLSSLIDKSISVAKNSGIKDIEPY